MRAEALAEAMPLLLDRIAQRVVGPDPSSILRAQLVDSAARHWPRPRRLHLALA